MPTFCANLQTDPENCNACGAPCMFDQQCIGGTCRSPKRAFVTSTLQTGAMGGLNGADGICQMRANGAGFSGTYRAWLSDATTDAYCRMHNLGGRRAQSCGQAVLPVSAGPWVRPDGLAFAPRIDRLMAPTYALFNPASLDESATPLPVSAMAWSATDNTGAFKPVFATTAVTPTDSR